MDTPSITPPLRKCTKCGVEFPATAEYFCRNKSKKNRLNSECKTCASENARRWAQANPEKHRENARRWAQANPEKARRRYQVNPEKVRENVRRRRSRKHSLPHTFTVETWEACLNYFHGCCAYCGAQRDFWSPLHQDHYIPLTTPDCPGTIPTNIVPACRTCNSSKKDANPLEWLTRKFGKRQAKVIAARIQAYFDSLAI